MIDNMSAPLHTSGELHGNETPPHAVSNSNGNSTLHAHMAEWSAFVDADGLRCEVRSMRSVPHALYTLPSISNVVSAYVRQLMQDFTSSLLLCRPSKQRVYPQYNSTDRSINHNKVESPTGAQNASYVPAALVAGASMEDEETYLLLRLCALEARRRRQRRRAQLRERQLQARVASGTVNSAAPQFADLKSDGESDMAAEVEQEEEDSPPDWLWDSSVQGDRKRRSSSANSSTSDDASCWVTVRVKRNYTQVEEQLLQLFAEAENARRGLNGSNTMYLDATARQSNFNFGTFASTPQEQQEQLRRQPQTLQEKRIVVDALRLTPPLLSALLRFKPLLRDMQFLSQHLLLPRHAWPHNQRMWVSVYEDVSVTLRGRLARYRRTIAAADLAGAGDDAEVGSSNSEKEQASHLDGRGEARGAVRSARRVVPAGEIAQLWHALWELLGAAWRQRDRLWGAYRYLQGPRQLPPLLLNSRAAHTHPPGVHASPLLRDHFTRHLMHMANLHNPSAAAGSCARSSSLPASLVSMHEEDCCAFGPFTSADVGVSAEKLYVLRQPLAAALRLLRVCVPPTGRDALVTSTSAFAGFTYVKEPAKRPTASTTQPPATPPPRSPVVVPLFDPTEEDARLCAAVPYLSPEVYLSQQLQSPCNNNSNNPIRNTNASDGGGSSTRSLHAPVHSFSDDVWNAAVVVLEAALCGFAVGDAAQCHLSHVASTTGTPALVPGVKEKDKEASPDAVPPALAAPPSPQLLSLLPTESVYTDVIVVLVERHGLSRTAANNFLYATLYHFQTQLRRWPARSGGESESDSSSSSDSVNMEYEKEDEQQQQQQQLEGGRRGAVTPEPERLAREWVSYLRHHYKHDFIAEVLVGEVAAKGLCWRRSERWNMFGLAHISAMATVNTASCDSISNNNNNNNNNGDNANTSGVNSTNNSILSPLGAGYGGATGRGRPTFSRSATSFSGGSVGSISAVSDDATNSLLATGCTNAHRATEEVNEVGPAVHAAPMFFHPAPKNEIGAAPDSDANTNGQSLAVQRPSRPSSFASFDALLPTSPSVVQSPLRGGGAASFAAYPTTVTRLPQTLDRVVNTLDTPLMPLFGLPSSVGLFGEKKQGQRAAAAATSPLLSTVAATDARADQKQRDRRRALRDGGEDDYSSNDGDGVWERLTHFLYHRASSAVLSVASGSYNVNANTRVASGSRRSSGMFNSSGGGGGGQDKANGAVADAADVDYVEELLHLLYACVLVTLREPDPALSPSFASSSKSAMHSEANRNDSAEDRARYAAVNHPFFRGVAERDLLNTYITVCGCSAGINGRRRSSNSSNEADRQRHSVLPSLNLYVPASVLLSTIALLSDRGHRSCADMIDSGVTDRVAAAANVMAAMVRLTKQVGTLRMLIGDDVRAWEAARDTSRRSRADFSNYLTQYMRYPSPAPVHRARNAVGTVLNSLELSVAAQTSHMAELRRLLLEQHSYSSDLTERGGGVIGRAVAQEVRRYLHLHTVPLKNEADLITSHHHHSHARSSAWSEKGSTFVSPFFAVPPTLRGVLWGCLLQVPPSRKREAIFAYAVHSTAAKPSLNDRQLSVDIPRCHAYHPLLSTSRGSAQLQRLLRAWLFLHPRCAYWQGLDSVCAVLLTVSPHDEALVLAQLSAVVDRFIAHDEGSEEGVGSRSSLLQSSFSSLPRQQQQQQQSISAVKPTMAEQLHRLSVVLRYCDPLLAHYLFNVLGCTPELFAISWLLTLFSHSLPMRKVYLLWDLLFVYGDANTTNSSSSSSSSNGSGSTCLVALCVAVVLRRRATLLSSDFSSCLSTFSSNASQLDVVAAVADTRQLMAVLPPSVLAQPCAEGANRSNTLDGLYGGRRSPLPMHGGGEATDAATVAYMSVDDLKAAWLAAQRRSPQPANITNTGSRGSGAAAHAREQDPPQQQQQQHWSDSGVYLVDIRHEGSREGPLDAVLGAIHLPLYPAGAAAGVSSSPPSSQRTSELSDLQAESRFNRLRRTEDGYGSRREGNVDAAGDGWGIVEEQERLQQQQQRDAEALERHIADAAAELVRHLSNPAVAAIVPRTADFATTTTTAMSGGKGTDGAAVPPWSVHPMVLKTSMAPHVVIIASGKSGSGNGSPASAMAIADAGEDVLLAHQLGLQLNACGVHNVSVLRGGVAAIRWAMPELVVLPSRSLT